VIEGGHHAAVSALEKSLLHRVRGRDHSGQTAYGGTPVNISAPSGKYMLDYEPFATWPPPGSGSMLQFVGFSGASTTVTLPDGRVLPTGWSRTSARAGSNPVRTGSDECNDPVRQRLIALG
jgi:hypothetical protein